MDQVSISRDCITLLPRITSVCTNVAKFVLNVRDAGRERDSVAMEIEMLGMELESIKPMLERLAQVTKDCPNNSLSIIAINILVFAVSREVEEIEEWIADYTDMKTPRSVKWATSRRENIGIFRSNLVSFKINFRSFTQSINQCVKYPILKIDLS